MSDYIFDLDGTIYSGEYTYLKTSALLRDSGADIVAMNLDRWSLGEERKNLG